MKEHPIVWTYVITNDDGSAPNYQPPLTTLAVCKPHIRRQAQIGDLVLAFCGKTLSVHRDSVRWAGLVSETIEFADYWNDHRFRGKRPDQSDIPDNIYKSENGILSRVDNNTHGFDRMLNDLSGKNVLLFQRWWYFGELETILPEYFELRIAQPRQGHRWRSVGKGNLSEILRWLDNQSQCEPPIAGRSDSTAKSQSSCTKC